MVKSKGLMGAAVVALSTALSIGATTFGGIAAAQDLTSGALTGLVTDSNGAPLSGATITLRSNDRGFTRSSTTGATGSYRLGQLPSGTYTVTIGAGGYQSVVNDSIRISISSAAAFNAALVSSSGSDGDEIVVSGQAQSISAFDANTTGLAIDVGELSARIPVSRDIQSIALLAPGTALTDSGFTGGTNRGGDSTQIGISGASVGENQFFVNGFNISDFNDFIGASVIPFEFYDQVEVKTGGVSAEFGRATGGFVNATVKSGTNELKGGFAAYYTPNEFRSQNSNTYNFDGEGGKSVRSANALDKANDAEVNLFLSGPIIEDKLFFYFLANLNDESSTDIVNGTGFVEESTDPTFGGKIDFFLTDTQHFEYTFFKDEQTFSTSLYDTTSNAQGDPTGIDKGGFRNTDDVTNGGSNHILKYSGEINDWLSVSAMYGTGENANFRNAQDPSTFAASDLATGTRLTPYGPGIFETTLNERDMYRVDVDVAASFFGEHQIRIGYDKEELTASFDDRYPGAEKYTIDLGPNGANVRGAVANPDGSGNYQMETRGGSIQVRSYNADGSINRFRIRSRIASSQFSTENEAFYVQDAYTPVPNVTLNLGVRFETFANSNASGEVFYETDTVTSPRLGVNWDTFGDGTLQFSGFYGRYYLPIATNTNFRLAGNERDVRSEYDALAGFDLNDLIGEDGRIKNARFRGSSSVFSNGETADTRETVSANLKPQYVDELIVGVNHVVTSASPLSMGGMFDDWEFGLTYTKRELFDALEDAAVDAAVLAYCKANGIENCEDTWSGFHHYVLVNPGGPIKYSTDDAPIGKGDGNFVNLTIDGSFLPEAKREYDAVTLSFERPFDGKWSLQGNYTWSDLEGNYEGSVKSDNAQADPGLTQDFDQPGLTDGSYGKLPQHREHQLKLWGNYAVNDRFEIGANFSLTSPRQFGCIGNHPTDQFAALYNVSSFYCVPQDFKGTAYQKLTRFGVNSPADVGLPANTPELSDVTRLTPRGSQLESDWIRALNMSFLYRPEAGDDRLSLRVDVFNLFDEEGIRDIDENGEVGGSFGSIKASPNYGAARSYQAPRSVRFGVRYEF